MVYPDNIVPGHKIKGNGGQNYFLGGLEGKDVFVPLLVEDGKDGLEPLFRSISPLLSWEEKR
jgi:hypothetical protein